MRLNFTGWLLKMNIETLLMINDICQTLKMPFL